MPSEHRVVLCNAPPAAAEGLAEALVERRLAACVNVIPGVTSVYRWQGELCKDQEYTLLIKTTRGRLSALTTALEALHPYDLPEIIALPICPGEGQARYLEWVTKEVSEEP
jgi:periplasmic divalent cation tolerance protein